MNTSTWMSLELVGVMLKRVINQVQPDKPSTVIYKSRDQQYEMNWSYQRDWSRDIAQFVIRKGNITVVYYFEYGLNGIDVSADMRIKEQTADTVVCQEKVFFEMITPIHEYVCYLTRQYQFPIAYIPEGDEYPIYTVNEPSSDTLQAPRV